MSAWHHFYEFWVGQQTLPGNILGDILIGAATFIIGKYKVAPWLHQRHREHLEQKERQHQEVLQCHRDLYDLHERQHRELIEATRGGASGAPAADDSSEAAAPEPASDPPELPPVAPSPPSGAI